MKNLRLFLWVWIGLAAFMSGQVVNAQTDAPPRAEIAIRPISGGGFQHAGHYFDFPLIVPGETVRGQAELSNMGNAPGTFRFYAVDVVTNDQGSLALELASDVLDESGTWFELDAETVTLAPGEHQEVAFAITVPTDAASGDHVAGLVVELASEESSSDPSKLEENSVGIQVQIRNRIATVVLMNIPGEPVEKLAFNGAAIGGSEGFQNVLFGLSNEGNVNIAPQGTLKVLDAAGRELQSWDVAFDYLLPGDEIQFARVVEEQALDVGEYQAVVNLTYGTGKQLNETVPFTIAIEELARVFDDGSQPLAAPSSLLQPEDTKDRFMVVAMSLGLFLTAVFSLYVWVQRRRKQQLISRFYEL